MKNIHRWIRASILEAGVSSFPDVALREQFKCDRVDLARTYGKPFAATMESLSLHELSEVTKTQRDMLTLVWFAEMDGDNPVHYVISKPLPPSSGFDYITYQKDRVAARSELEQYQSEIQLGASFEELAEEVSDSYVLSGVDISDTYQSRYGFSFSKQLSAIPAGGMGIVESSKGVHLVWVKSKEVVSFSNEFKNQIVTMYQDGLESQPNRYKITKKQHQKTGTSQKTTPTRN